MHPYRRQNNTFTGLSGGQEALFTVPHRFSFNGMEKDDEVKEIGNSLDFGARVYDSRLGRWLGIEPLFIKYPSQGTYTFVANAPLIYIDPDGKKIIYVIYDKYGNALETLEYKKGNFYRKDGTRYDPSSETTSKHLYTTLEALREIEKSGDADLIHKLRTVEESKRIHYIRRNNIGEYNSGVRSHDPASETVTEEENKVKNGEGVGTITHFDFTKESKADFKKTEGVPSTNTTITAHELSHIYDFDQGCNQDDQLINSAKDPSEIRAVKTENRIRKILKLPIRISYGGVKIDLKKLNDK